MQDEIGTKLADRMVGHYLGALSGGSPTPGGGSAAGMAGALGCALGSMVCNLTLARKPLASIADQQRIFLDLQQAMMALAEADERVFGAYREAAALPRATDEEKRVRREAIEKTLVDAAEVPVDLATQALEALSLLQTTAIDSTPHAVGDLLTGGYLLQATVLGSIENIEANAGLMKIPENRERFEMAASSINADLASAMIELQTVVATRRKG